MSRHVAPMREQCGQQIFLITVRVQDPNVPSDKEAGCTRKNLKEALLGFVENTDVDSNLSRFLGRAAFVQENGAEAQIRSLPQPFEQRRELDFGSSPAVA